MVEVKVQVKKDYERGMIYKDIAAKHDIKINTIKSWQRREKWIRDATITVPAKKIVGIVSERVAPVETIVAEIVAPANAIGSRNKWIEIKEKLTLIEAWARNGLSNEQIANNLGISLATLYNYKNIHKEFLDALKRGKEVTDIAIENALYKKALGYAYEEITQEPLYNIKTGLALEDDEGKRIIAVSKIVTKHLSPDVNAIKFWLTNRNATDWREKKEVDLNATVGKKLEDYLE